MKSKDLNSLLEKNKKNTQKLMNKQESFAKQATSLFGFPGRIFGSKSFYNHKNPRNITVFNSNICTKDGKIWYGDLDITNDEDKLIELAHTIKQTIYVLYEMDARFENETSPKLEKAVYTVEYEEDDEAEFIVGSISALKYYERSKSGKLKGKIVLKKEFAHDMSHLYGKKRKTKKTK